MADWQLAQINIALAKDGMESDTMASFVARLDEINTLAEASEGFVWRLKDEGGDATAIRVYDNPSMLINQSVWSSLDALKKFVYRSIHVELLRKKADWFEKMEGPHQALWWVPAGHEPAPEEGRERLAELDAIGPTSSAFTFARPFQAPTEQESPT